MIKNRVITVYECCKLVCINIVLVLGEWLIPRANLHVQHATARRGQVSQLNMCAKVTEVLLNTGAKIPAFGLG